MQEPNSGNLVSDHYYRTAEFSFTRYVFSRRESQLTQRAPDWWESARFQAFYVA
jgi:hypothetical protein